MPTVRDEHHFLSTLIAHTTDVYPFPRFTVLPEHAAKSFIPLSKVLARGRVTDTQGNLQPSEHTGSPLPPAAPVTEGKSPHRLVQGIITDLTSTAVTFVTPNADGNYDDVADSGADAPSDRRQTIQFDYCVYALGGTLSEPSDAWGDHGRNKTGGRGTKKGGIEFLARQGKIIASAQQILVVGGGALGIREFGGHRTQPKPASGQLTTEFATDIKETYPSKEVTLLHSRERLMPIYNKGLHDEVVRRCAELGVNVVLGERVMEWPTNPGVVDGTTKTVTTNKGSKLTADLVLVCTGTKPHTGFMNTINKDTIAPNGCIRIKATMQVRTEGEDDTRFDHFFAVGDCADTTAIRAGHMAFAMGSVAARNIIRVIEAREAGREAQLEIYVPEEAKIKVTLGRVSCGRKLHGLTFQKHNCIATPETSTPGDQGMDHLGAKAMWALAGAQDMGDDE